ncbi:MAG: GNAT family N-acetyltransferase [Pseudomonadales bacterium]|nr:GNAT family N-acetyltransferase [Pseudomonadales bacterium]
MVGLQIRPLEAGDRDAWQSLYAGYAAFYALPLTTERADRLWSWLLDPDHPVEGRLAVRGHAVGLAHFRDMPSPLRATTLGFLDDLFVDPSVRGGGVAEALLGELAAIGRARGWPAFRWITRENNFRARGLYERVAQRTDWVTYEYACG